MRAAVCADTHGDIAGLLAVLRCQRVEEVWHAGDFLRDGEALAAALGLPLRGVVGNCDRDQPGPEELVFAVHGRRVLLTHGHRQRVKSHLLALMMRAREVGADIVVFGHTHLPLVEEERGILFINPGSAGLPRAGAAPTWALLEIEGAKAHAAIMPLAP
ncbi:MAG: metallophosphoesterase [Syntrophomonadaceae bacterium]|nr:metallophosphoesterase [Syntrophomonadaceae bacterium]